MEDGGEFCSVDLELHLHGGWRRMLLALLVWRMSCSIYLEDGGGFCSDNLELHPHGGWRRISLCWFGK